MSVKVDLLIIDGQTDFCDPSGSLFVSGANKDMQRVANMVNRISDKLNDIHVTLDTHHYFDIAHPIFWRDTKGNHPNPFTIITADDVKNSVWTPSVPSLFKRALEYVNALEKSGRYPLCVWPPHCLIGSDGIKVYPELYDALVGWEKAQAGNMVDYVTKGSNFMTEHYSAIKAEVIDPMDTTTQVNTRLIETLEKADIIAVMGEASSHCLANTVRDIVTEFANPDYVKKLVYLKDGASPVTGFEAFEKNFIDEMTAKGMQISTTVDFLS